MKRPTPSCLSIVTFLCLIVSNTVFGQTDSVTITEVMVDPLGSESTDEFIEIYNFSKTQTIDLTNWMISDSAGGNDSDKIVNAGEGMFLYPGQFSHPRTLSKLKYNHPDTSPGWHIQISQNRPKYTS